MRRQFALVAAALLSGCIVFDGEVTASVDDACTAVCDCLFFSPTQSRRCVDQCVVDPDFATAPDECFGCLASSSCAILEAGGCNDVCFTSSPAAEPEPGSGR